MYVLWYKIAKQRVRPSFTCLGCWARFPSVSLFLCRILVLRASGMVGHVFCHFYGVKLMCRFCLKKTRTRNHSKTSSGLRSLSLSTCWPLPTLLTARTPQLLKINVLPSRGGHNLRSNSSSEVESTRTLKSPEKVPAKDSDFNGDDYDYDDGSPHGEQS